VMSYQRPADDKRCDHCDRPGIPYTYRGQTFSGLTPNLGERLCPSCLDRAVTAEVNAPVGWANVPASQYITVGSSWSR
jgi:uncharacterized protein CbrC (UPF0167 family)